MKNHFSNVDDLGIIMDGTETCEYMWKPGCECHDMVNEMQVNSIWSVEMTVSCVYHFTYSLLDV